MNSLSESSVDLRFLKHRTFLVVTNISWVSSKAKAYPSEVATQPNEMQVKLLRVALRTTEMIIQACTHENLG